MFTGSTRCATAGTLQFPAINVNDAVTKSKFDNKIRHPPQPARRHQPRHRRHDRWQDLRRVRLRRRRQGLRRGAARPRGPGLITEIDPICALQAAMDGYEVTTIERVVGTADIFITSTGNKDILSAEMMSR